MGSCLRRAPSTTSALVKDNTTQGVTTETSKALEGHDSHNTYLHEASKESIGIYARSICQ